MSPAAPSSAGKKATPISFASSRNHAN
jgi:hypothetical protein